MKVEKIQCCADMNMFMFILTTFAANGGFGDKWLEIASDSMHAYFAKE